MKMSENVERRKKYDDIALPSQICFKKCVCLLLRPRTYIVLSLLYCSMGAKLIQAYFFKKTAQALNDINYPLQALYFAERAEDLIPNDFTFVRKNSYINEESFDIDVVRASIKRTQAASCILIKNTYSATVYAQQALKIFGIELIYFFGVLRRREFRKILKRQPLLHAEEITKTISLLSQSLVTAKEYDIALKVLDLEYVALTCYPTDFLQLLNFMISSYLCQTLRNPRKKFRKLESNTLNICLDRLQNHNICPTLKEVKIIGKAYATAIKANLVKNRLKSADVIGQKALMILEYTNDPDCIIELCLLLIDIYIFEKRSDECWKYLNILSSLLDDNKNYDIFALHYCGLSAAILLDNASTNENQKIEMYAKKCNEFASHWNMNMVQTMPKDLAFYVSAKMSVWCHKVSDIFSWPESKTVFIRCYEMADNLIKDQVDNSYWSIGGSLAYFRTKFMTESSAEFKENKVFVLEQLNIIKEKVSLRFPVYEKECNKLINDIKMFPTEHLED